MRIKLLLCHPVTETTAVFTLDEVSPGGIMKVMQEQGPAALDKCVKALAREKIPTHLYTYNIADWSIEDDTRSLAA